MRRRVLVVLGFVVLIALLVVVIASARSLWWWIEVHTGTVNEPGPYYGFWSGFGSDIGESTLFVGMIGLYRKFNCHSKGCWRLAHHDYDLDGVTYRVCRVCHPGIDHRNRPHRHHFREHHERTHQ